VPPQYAPPPGYAPPGYAPLGYATPTGPTGTSGVAIASLVLGLLGVLCFPSGIAAIVCGAIGLSKTKDPRVGGRGLAIAGLTLGIAGMVFSCFQMSVLLPSLNRARETANRVKCASNMRQIGQAILLYANENHGQYPPDLPTLLKTEPITSNVFVCPSSSDTNANGPGDLMAGGHLSYVYVGKDMTNLAVGPSTVLLYENPGAHGGDGMNVLFGDGHVEFFGKAVTAQIIKDLNAGNNPPSFKSGY
jgi:prepilin-type processing-associated H-X9-DG protein